MKIWTAWLQGRKNAPSHVQKIFDLWEMLNPTATVTVLEQPEVEAILTEMRVPSKNLTPQVKTNIARTYLLARHGGTWVDSTLLPTCPLESWLTTDLRQQGFFAFRSSGHPDLVLQNWFLYAAADNPIIVAWLDHYCDYFRSRRYSPQSRRIFLSPYILDHFRGRNAIKSRDFRYFSDPNRGRACRVYPYAMHNYTLAHLLKTNPALAGLWNGVPTRFHAQPSVIGSYAKDRETPPDIFLGLALELLRHAPVHKLNHQDQRFEALIDEAVSQGLISAAPQMRLSCQQ